MGVRGGGVPWDKMSEILSIKEYLHGAQIVPARKEEASLEMHFLMNYYQCKIATSRDTLFFSPFLHHASCYRDHLGTWEVIEKLWKKSFTLFMMMV